LYTSRRGSQNRAASLNHPRIPPAGDLQRLCDPVEFTVSIPEASFPFFGASKDKLKPFVLYCQVLCYAKVRAFGNGLQLKVSCSISPVKKVKKRKFANRSSAAKRYGAPKNAKEYLAGVPQPARSILNKMRATIRSAVPPEATEIISYGIPAFKHGGVLVWYAAFSGHCSLFPTAAVIEAFKDELKSFSTSKGTIKFPLGKPLPIALIKKLVKARVKQIESKKRG
jgi:uncharacterized protein YdhG (YjbR/CyaY superfamily)